MRKLDLDLIIEKGLLIDGTGMPGKKMDVGIKGNKIEVIEDRISCNTCTRIDAEGMIVAPGFIDIHSHSDFLWLACRESESKILDGVTTEVCGNCGLSAFPLRGKLLERRRQGLSKYGIVPSWRSAQGFFDVAEGINSSVNRAFLVGHGNIRACAVGYDNRVATKAELSVMCKYLEEAMKAGAFGMSSGLVYPPGCYAEFDELVTMCNRVNEYGGLYATHVRNEGEDLENAIAEAIKVAEETGVNVQISHIKTMGQENWHKLEKVKALIAYAINTGVNVTCDRYPYTAAATDLDVILPAWVYDGGIEDQIQRLKDRAVRKRIAEEMSKGDEAPFWSDIVISSVSTQKNRWMTGKSIAEIAAIQKKPPLEEVLDLLIEEDTRVDIFLFNMSEKNLESILSWDFVCVGSDSSTRSGEGVLAEGNPHPRSYGTFSRILGKFCREKKLFSVEEAIRKMTGLPAQKAGLDQRGFIKEGYFADITIFNPETITDKSTFANPHQYSVGVEYVIVNGNVTVQKGKHSGIKSGKILRKTL
ncbi:D-aminoacylase [Candidatus Kuenenia sp.]|uniref:N-acyl-D-amino-acid deacylase family protein n=1 Tax=Candidatus Kuenenia sp. TaxID=2499824 RepID=UPI00321FF99D